MQTLKREDFLNIVCVSHLHNSIVLVEKQVQEIRILKTRRWVDCFRCWWNK